MPVDARWRFADRAYNTDDDNHGQLRAGDAGIAIVLRMHAVTDVAAAAEVVAEIFDLVEIDVRRAHFDVSLSRASAWRGCVKHGTLLLSFHSRESISGALLYLK